MLRRAEFSTVRRGYRPEEVSALLAAAADALEKARADAQGALTQLRDVRDAGGDADPAEVVRLSDEVARLRESLARQRADADTRIETLRSELTAARTERDEALTTSRGTPSESDLMDMAGEHVGRVLRNANEIAGALRKEADDQSRQRLQAATLDAERIRREAEQEALLIRREAQEDADSVAAEARRDAESVRHDADGAASIARADAERDADEIRRSAGEYSAEARAATDGYARETTEAAHRDARRIVSEAESQAAGKLAAAERQANETPSDARRRAAEIEGQLAAHREREEQSLQQMRQAREALANHLNATRSGLDQVLSQVADERVRALVGSESHAAECVEIDDEEGADQAD